ncbi:MAG TPA: hypothetical protein PLZ57_09595 [Pseudobdellovibrionaceae bacterium]|nr:hypothetical protein [Pseudobdellovibrionaceae bacterium]
MKSLHSHSNSPRAALKSSAALARLWRSNPCHNRGFAARPLTAYALSALAAISLYATDKAQAQVWTETQQWNQDWEDRYAAWVETDVNEDIFTKGRWAGLSHDCADAAYYARAIFAYENKLPFAMRDPSGGSQLITNRMTRFNGQAEDRRVRSFLSLLGDLSSTKTIGQDTYPVRVDREFVRPGGVWARPTLMDRSFWNILSGSAGTELPGHAEIIKQITAEGVIWKLESTVPRAVRDLNLTSNMWFLPENHQTGLRKWLTPEQYSRPFASLPGYSLEQFKELGTTQAQSSHNDSSPSTGSGQRTLDQFKSDLATRLAHNGAQESAEGFYRRNAKSLCGSLRVRAEAVSRALAYKQRIGGRCMNPSEYDQHSTPSRDRRARELLAETAKRASTFGFFTDGALREILPYLDAECPGIEIAPGRHMRLSEWAVAAKNNQLSSDPNQSLEARWGMAAADSRCSP